MYVLVYNALALEKDKTINYDYMSVYVHVSLPNMGISYMFVLYKIC